MKRLILLLTLPIYAHDLYLMPKKFQVTPGETILVSIHNGDAFPDSEDSIDPRRLSGSPLKDTRVLGKATHGFYTVPAEASRWIYVRTEPRKIEMTPQKFESYLREEGLDPIVVWRDAEKESDKQGRELYSKYAKSLLASGAGSDEYQQILGLPIEFVFGRDPYAMKPGESLPVQVLFRGKPAAGLQVEAAWATPDGQHSSTVVGRTGTDGRIDIPLGKAAIWRLHALTMERRADRTEADWESFWASATFELP